MKKQSTVPTGEAGDIEIDVIGTYQPENMSLLSEQSIVDDLDGMSTSDIQRSLDRVAREIKSTPAGKTSDADVLVVDTLEILHRRATETEEAREGFAKRLENVDSDIKRMIVERQHLRNEIVQCDRIIDSLKLSIVGLDIT